MKKEKLLLGDILLKENLINKEQLDLALDHIKETGFRLGHSLVELGFLNDIKLAQILTEKLEQKCIVVPTENIPAKETLQLGYDFCLKNRCIPLKSNKNTITIAMVDPFDFNLIDDLKFLLHQDIHPQLATENSIYSVVHKYFLNKDKKKAPVQKEMPKSDSHIINAVNNILFGAIDLGASDIHLETFPEKMNIRFRIDGRLYYQKSPDKKDIPAIISRLKVMAHLNIAEKRLPQDGRIILKDKEYDVDVRVSVIPSIYGENIVLRILDKRRGKYELSDLGLESKDQKSIKQILQIPCGLILITGPTGSGKTTTLYSMLKMLNTPEKKILTIEEPVEYKIENVNQVEVNPKINLTFANALRSFLRHDPDIIMVGEIRDTETAQIAIRAALTGHLVLSTVHTNDAPSAITRLLDMGIEPFLLSSTIEMVISQRLVRKICDKCKAKITKTKEPLYKGKGCEECQGTGYKNRTGIFEVLSINDKIREAVHQKRSAQEIKVIAVKSGFVDLISDGKIKVKKGITTKEEVCSVIV